nr:unnamed protein product [Spirometra erinaceieuropaei]
MLIPLAAVDWSSCSQFAEWRRSPLNRPQSFLLLLLLRLILFLLLLILLLLLLAIFSLFLLLLLLLVFSYTFCGESLGIVETESAERTSGLFLHHPLPSPHIPSISPPLLLLMLIIIHLLLVTPYGFVRRIVEHGEEGIHRMNLRLYSCYSSSSFPSSSSSSSSSASASSSSSLYLSTFREANR